MSSFQRRFFLSSVFFWDRMFRILQHDTIEFLQRNNSITSTRRISFLVVSILYVCIYSVCSNINRYVSGLFFFSTTTLTIMQVVRNHFADSNFMRYWAYHEIWNDGDIDRALKLLMDRVQLVVPVPDAATLGGHGSRC